MRATRRAHFARAGTAWLGFALLVVITAALTSRGEASEHVDDARQRGGQLYAMYCTACHGASGQGGPGPGVLAGPRIDDIDVAYADLVIRTGRMPIVERDAGIIRDPNLDARDRDLLVAWMAETFGLDGEVPDVPDGDTAQGRLLFNENCAACHSTTGWGGVTGGNLVALPVRDLDRIAIFSASRVGPFTMPSFPESVLSDQDLADIAAAVERMDDERPSPLAFLDLTHVSGTVYSVVGIAILVALLFWIARLPAIRVARDEEHEYRDPDEPEETS